jgi:hypothetical protein
MPIIGDNRHFAYVIDLNCHRKPEAGRRGMGKAAVNAPQSRRFAKFNDAGRARQRLECGGFSTAFPALQKCPLLGGYDVAPTGSRLCRGLAIRMVCGAGGANGPPVANRRHGRLPICATLFVSRGEVGQWGRTDFPDRHWMDAPIRIVRLCETWSGACSNAKI